MKRIIWAGNIPFKEWEHIREYKRVLLEYHHILQKGKCLYCKNETPLKEKGIDKAPNRHHATLEHLEQVWETKERWKETGELRDLDGIVAKSYGDMTVENTAMACAECNNTRPWDRTVYAHKKHIGIKMQNVAA